MKGLEARELSVLEELAAPANGHMWFNEEDEDIADAFVPRRLVRVVWCDCRELDCEEAYEITPLGRLILTAHAALRQQG